MPTTTEAIDTALIIDEPWIDYILRGEKTWEMRAQPTHKRGRIGLIRKGSGTIVGEATLVDCLAPLSRAQMLENLHKHRIPEEMIVSGQVEKWRYPWVLADVERYEAPIPYAHPNGAVIWVNVRELKGTTDSPAFEGPGLGSAIKRMSNPDSAAIVQTAETLAAKYLRRLGTPTKYIAGFQSKAVASSRSSVTNRACSCGSKSCHRTPQGSPFAIRRTRASRMQRRKAETQI